MIIKKVIQIPLIPGADQKRQMEKINKAVREEQAIKAGPFIAIIKKPDGTKNTVGARTIWRLIFRLGIELENKYSQLLRDGIIIKVVRGTEVNK